MSGEFEEKAQLLLRRVYDLAGSEPGAPMITEALVDAQEVVQGANVEFGSSEYRELAEYLVSKGYITYQGENYRFMQITAPGIEEAGRT